MINKESISKDNFKDLWVVVAKEREDTTKQDEALLDIKTLRMFAVENNLLDFVVESLLEEALVWQHKYMGTHEEKFLDQMEQVVTGTGDYIRAKGLTQWESRVARFLGRVSDYRKNYGEAARFYQEAIEKIVGDPKYADNPAMVFEYRGFKVMDDIRLSQGSEGVGEAKKLYEDYLFSEEGKVLREKDYSTWAIWRSGVLINLSRTLLDLGLIEKYKAQILEWLERAEQDLQVPEGVSVWTDFGFRKKEISQIRDMLGG